MSSVLQRRASSVLASEYGSGDARPSGPVPWQPAWLAPALREMQPKNRQQPAHAHLTSLPARCCCSSRMLCGDTYASCCAPTITVASVRRGLSEQKIEKLRTQFSMFC